MELHFSVRGNFSGTEAQIERAIRAIPEFLISAGFQETYGVDIHEWTVDLSASQGPSQVIGRETSEAGTYEYWNEKASDWGPLENATRFPVDKIEVFPVLKGEVLFRIGGD